jgi:hypothetical protein
MSIDNWKLWMIPFAAWLVVMAWYTGYQSGYSEGHQTAWQMSRPTIELQDGELVVNYDPAPTVTRK